MKKLIFVIFILFITQACQKEEIRVCQSEPPHGIFLLLDKESKPVITDANRSSLRIWYQKEGKLTQWNFDPNKSPNVIKNAEGQIIFRITEILQEKTTLSNLNFEIHLEGKKIASVSAKIGKNDTPCNQWNFISELFFENKIIPPTLPLGIYVLNL